MTWFNDNEPYVAAWLRTLYPEAVIDERSILDVRAADLVGHSRCHFFAGIGGWQYALELAGWPEDEPVWTASLPCQPFSAAGRADGVLDERHLWPAFYRLIAQCRPHRLVGEQVASKAGRGWLAGIRHDLENLGYAVGAVALPACSVGAPHIRERLFWVAESESRREVTGRSGHCGIYGGGLQATDNAGWEETQQSRHIRHDAINGSGGPAGGPSPGGGLADAEHDRNQRRVGEVSSTGDPKESRQLQLGRAGIQVVDCGPDGGLADADRGRRQGLRVEEHAGLDGASGDLADGSGDDRQLDREAP